MRPDVWVVFEGSRGLMVLDYGSFALGKIVDLGVLYFYFGSIEH